MAYSSDAESWTQLQEPLVEPVEGEFDNIYGPAFVQYDKRYFITYQDMTSWRGGNLKYVEVDSALNKVGNGGERYVLLDPPAGPPLNDRYRGSEFYIENDTFYMYSSASRDPRLIVYATAGAVPEQSGPDTTVTDPDTTITDPDTTITDPDTANVGLELNELIPDVYPNPFNEVLFIDVPNISEGLVVKLYDLNGRIHKSLILDNMHNRITIENLAGGIYILEIVETKNYKVYRQKLIRVQ